MEGSKLFYGDKTLKGYIYYYYLPRLPFQCRKELSDKIFKYDGKITLSLNTQSIIILQLIEDLQSTEFKKEIKGFGDIALFHHNKVYNIQHNTSVNDDKQLRCILLSDFLQGISQFEIKERLFNVFASYGLPLNIQKEGLVALFMSKDREQKTRWHQFNMIDNREKENKNEFEYDIPYYINDIPSNYAVFSTVEEKKRLIRYLSLTCSNTSLAKKSNSKGDKNKKSTKKQNIMQTPKPYSEHSYCHLCKMKYKDYYIHIDSSFHLETIDKNIEIYCRITDTFTRIKDYWKEKNGDSKDLSSSIDNSNQHQEQIEVRTTERLSHKSKQKEIDISKKTIQNVLMIEEKSVIISQQETQQTQYNTNISKHIERTKTEKSLSKKYKKKKYCDLIEENTTLLVENKRYLRNRNPHILHKVNKCIKKLSKG